MVIYDTQPSSETGESMTQNIKLSEKAVAIIATNGFEQSELFSPKKELEDRGVKVDIISIDEQKEIKAWDKNNWGKGVSVDKQINDAELDDYDAIVLPGGQINPDILRTHTEVVSFIKKAYQKNKIKAVAAICHGPWLLVEADLVEGKNIASYPSIQTDVKNAGGHWKDETIVIDGKLITSRNPDDLPNFNSAIIEKLAS